MVEADNDVNQLGWIPQLSLSLQYFAHAQDFRVIDSTVDYLDRDSTAEYGWVSRHKTPLVAGARKNPQFGTNLLCMPHELIQPDDVGIHVIASHCLLSRERIGMTPDRILACIANQLGERFGDRIRVQKADIALCNVFVGKARLEMHRIDQLEAEFINQYLEASGDRFRQLAQDGANFDAFPITRDAGGTNFKKQHKYVLKAPRAGNVERRTSAAEKMLGVDHCAGSHG